MRSPDSENGRFKVIGTRPVRHDGLDKVTGRAVYGGDVKLPGLVQAAVLRSPLAHARIKRINTSRASALAGVIAVMTGNDIPVGGLESERVMARETVVFKGHPIAAVAAFDKNTALEGIKLVEVEYETLPTILNVNDAMADGAPLVHEGFVGNHLGEPVEGTNIASFIRHELGDVDEGFASAVTVVEREVSLATVHQGYIEPQTGTAMWSENGFITVWTSTQGAFGIREQMAHLMDLPESKVEVVPTEIGGGFGGKLNVYLEPIAALLSKKCGRPVKVYMERTSVFEATGPAAAATVKVKMGVDQQGHISAATAELRYEAGAFPGAPIEAGSECCFAAYDIPNVKIDAYDVLVTKPKTQAYRAPGSTHVAFAVESVVDEICEKLGVDRIEFRLNNASRMGGRQALGPKWGKIGISEVLQAVRNSPHWRSSIDQIDVAGRRRGRGVATGYWRNAGRRSVVELHVSADGKISMVEGSVDIGGTRASIAMQAAEVLGVSAEDVQPRVVSTNHIGYTDSTGGSRTTYATGTAAIKAARQLVAEMKRRAALLWELDETLVGFSDGTFFVDSELDLKMSFKELAGKLQGTGGPVSATGSVDVEEAIGAFATHIVDLEVDTDTGKVDVLRYTAVQDVGTAIHPSYVEGQIQGGAAQGIGWALSEEYFMGSDGHMKNSSFLDYRMPTSLDLPDIETILVEVHNPLHPFGAKGVGEVPIAPPVAAVANALYNALGIRFRTTPMKPGVVLAAVDSWNP